MKHTVICHRAPELDVNQLQGFAVAATTKTREELATALAALRAPLLVIGLDDDEAVNTIVASLEQNPELAIVGVTDGSRVDRVIAATRAGCRQVSTLPIDAQDMSEALRRAMPAREADANGRTVGVIGSTGGAGGTMLACHLVIELARQSGEPTLVADLDLDFGGVARAFDLQPQYTIADLAKATTVDRAVVEKSAVALKGCPAYVLARPGSIEEAHTITGQTVSDVIRVGKDIFRNQLFDLPRKLDEITGAAIERVDELLLVVQLTVPSVDNALRLIEVLRTGGVGREKIRLVVNRYRRNVHACTLDMVQKRLSMEPIAIIPSDFAAVHQAIDAGEPLPDKHPVRSAVAEVAQHLLGQQSAAAPVARAAGNGWLQKLGIGR